MNVRFADCRYDLAEPTLARDAISTVRSLRVPSHVPSHSQTAANVRDFSPTA